MPNRLNLPSELESLIEKREAERRERERRAKADANETAGDDQPIEQRSGQDRRSGDDRREDSTV